MSQRVCVHVCQKNLRSKLINWDCGTAASQIQHDLSRDPILSHWIHKENRNLSLTALSSGSPVNPRSTKRLFNSCSVPSSKKHESQPPKHKYVEESELQWSANSSPMQVCYSSIFEKYC